MYRMRIARRHRISHRSCVGISRDARTTTLHADEIRSISICCFWPLDRIGLYILRAIDAMCTLHAYMPTIRDRIVIMQSYNTSNNNEWYNTSTACTIDGTTCTRVIHAGSLPYAHASSAARRPVRTYACTACTSPSFMVVRAQGSRHR